MRAAVMSEAVMSAANGPVVKKPTQIVTGSKFVSRGFRVSSALAKSDFKSAASAISPLQQWSAEPS